MSRLWKEYDSLCVSVECSRLPESEAAVMRAYGWDDLDRAHGHQEQPSLAESRRACFTMSDESLPPMARRFTLVHHHRDEQERCATPALRPRLMKGRAKAVSDELVALALADTAFAARGYP